MPGGVESSRVVALRCGTYRRGRGHASRRKDTPTHSLNFFLPHYETARNIAPQGVGAYCSTSRRVVNAADGREGMVFESTQITAAAAAAVEPVAVAVVVAVDVGAFGAVSIVVLGLIDVEGLSPLIEKNMSRLLYNCCQCYCRCRCRRQR